MTNTDRLQDRVDDLEQAIRITGHDLQAPIRRMANLAELVMRRYPIEEPRLAALIEQIARDATLASNRVSGLMKYSRTGRKVRFAVEPVKHAVEAAVGAARRRLEHANFEVVVEAEGQLLGDHALLERALVELIENALAFASEVEQPSLSIRCTGTERDWQIEVSDNGPGIPSEARARVFDLFGKLDREVGGIGVGLTVVRRIARLHRGDAWIEDTESGATVKMSGQPTPPAST